MKELLSMLNNVFLYITMKKIFLIAVLGVCIMVSRGYADNLTDYSWYKIASKMPADWYGSQEAITIANRVLEFQMNNGGWSKNIEYHKEEIAAKKLKGLDKSGIGATIDNQATTLEMRFLAKVYQYSNNPAYKEGFLKGFNYILEAQYDNGGWPQFYPVRKGRSVAYSGCITFNDDAYINVMNLLKDIYESNPCFAALNLDIQVKQQARTAFDKGMKCILDTQIVVDGKKTVWCAQHDQYTLKPAKARAYELPSFSGDESADIVLLLMSVDNPTPDIIASVKGAVEWFDTHKIANMRFERYRDEKGERNARLIPAAGVNVWARFYDLETGKPFFCDRDGVKRSSIDDLGKERRGGYSWYTSSPEKVLKTYSRWIKKNHL